METLTLAFRKSLKSAVSDTTTSSLPILRTQFRCISYFKHGKKNTAGHNHAGRITSYHRGGGSKRLLRNVDLKRITPSVGIVEKIEYDPNRSSRIALVRWVEGHMFRHRKKHLPLPPPSSQKLPEPSTAKVSSTFSFSSVPGSNVDGRMCPSDGESSSLSLNSFPRIAVAGAKPAFFAVKREDYGKDEEEEVPLPEIQKWVPHSPNWAHRLKRKAALSWKSLGQRDGAAAEIKASKPNAENGKLIPSEVISYAFRRSRDRPIEASGLGIVLAKPKGEEGDKVERVAVSYITASHQLEVGNRVVNYDGSKGSKKQESLDLNFQAGNCIPLSDIRLGTLVHDIELRPGQGAKLTRAAGTFAKVIKEPSDKCLLRLPSGREKLVDSRCRATIGIVSNLSHGARKLRKAGHSRWLGRRPVVRGVAMNPVDHPHGGGEGRNKGKPSVSPWGKPTKSGFKTAAKSKRDRI